MPDKTIIAKARQQEQEQEQNKAPRNDKTQGTCKLIDIEFTWNISRNERKGITT